jgi:hypothetical protein
MYAGTLFSAGDSWSVICRVGDVMCDVAQEKWWVRGEVVEARAVTFSRAGRIWLTSSTFVSPF